MISLAWKMSDDFGLFNAKKKNNYGLGIAFGNAAITISEPGGVIHHSAEGNRNEDFRIPKVV